MDRIELQGLSVDCVIGTRPEEREREQRLFVDIELWLPLERAARNEDLRATIDYVALSEQVSFFLREGKFRLLETAAYVLLRYLLQAPAAGEERVQVEKARVRLRKPDALEGYAVPVVELERDRDWCAHLAQAGTRSDVRFGAKAGKVS